VYESVIPNWEVTTVSSGDARVPFYARASDDGAQEFVRLHSGVPAWMRESLWEWLRKEIGNRKNSSDGFYWDPNVTKIREIERICRIDTRWEGRGSDYSRRLEGQEMLRGALYANASAFLTAVDLEVSRANESSREILELVLSDSASEWRVGDLDGRPALVKRIDETVQQAAEDLARQGTRAGKLLADAWRHAFSMHRDPSASYRCSVRAIEAAAGPVLTPADPRPSLGKMNVALRDGMGKWSFAFTVDSGVDPKNVLLEMMQLIWTNEYSRHVDADPDVPLHVSQGEAESAVVLALTLVNWFVSGAIRRI
jgi:hypothetical protein